MWCVNTTTGVLFNLGNSFLTYNFSYFLSTAEVVQTDLEFVCAFLYFTLKLQNTTREGFLRKNIVAVSFFQNCAIHQYS